MIKHPQRAQKSRSAKASVPKRGKSLKRDAGGRSRSRSQSPSKLLAVQKVSSEEGSTQLDEQLQTGYQGRLRVRRPIRKLSFEHRDEANEIESEDEYTGTGGKKNRRNGKHRLKRPERKVNDSKFSRLEKLLDWRRHYVEPGLSPDSCRAFSSPDICSHNLDEFGKDFQGIFLNVDWNRHSLRDLETLKISPSLMKNGIIFLWSHKEHLASIIKIMAEKQYKYVENVCIARIDAKSLSAPAAKKTASTEETKKQFMEAMGGSDKSPSDCFLHDEKNSFIRTCKMILLMFHRNLNSKENLELRHQRNPDAYFDIFVDERDRLDRVGKEVVYNLIETLLPRAVRTDGKALRLLELYAEAGALRNGWASVSEDARKSSSIK